MNTNNLVEFTGTYWWTLEEATELANAISKSLVVRNEPILFAILKGQYMTAIKGEPYNEDYPEECWAITNRYDPRIVALRDTNVNNKNSRQIPM